jgi:hypothetical protein
MPKPERFNILDALNCPLCGETMRRFVFYTTANRKQIAVKKYAHYSVVDRHYVEITLRKGGRHLDSTAFDVKIEKQSAPILDAHRRDDLYRPDAPMNIERGLKCA